MSALIQRRLLLYIPFALVILAFVVGIFVWRAAVTELRAEVENWIAARKAEGYVVVHDGLTTSGFPVFIRVIAENPSITPPTDADEAPRWTWRGEALAVEALPYDLTQLVLAPEGRQSVQLANGDLFELRADRARVRLAEDAERGWRISSDFAKLEFSAPRFAGAAKRVIFNAAPAADGAQGFTLALAGTGIARNQDVPYNDGAGVGLENAEFVADVVLGGAGLRGIEKIFVRTARLSHGEDAAEARGVLEINTAGRTNGVLEVAATGGPALGGAVGAAGLLPEEDAMALGFGLGVMAAASGEGSGAEVRINDSAVSVGGRTIMTLPAIGPDAR